MVVVILEKLYLHQIVREDAHLLYGFYTKEERTLFRQLISVSGIGANTANVMLSSMSVQEITGAIVTENVNAIKSVKGIGLKTALLNYFVASSRTMSAEYCLPER